MTEWNASDYNRISTLQKVMAEEHLGRLTLHGDERVLDIGCGDGKVTAEIAARLPRGSVLGVDPSTHMIDFASSHFSTPAHANLRFAVADVRNLPYRGEFDRVVSFNALHWVPEQDAALRSIRAVLKLTGSTLLQFVPRAVIPAVENVIEETRQTPRWASYFSGFRQPFAHYTPDEYRALAAAAGLRVERIDVESHAWDFGSRDSFIAFCRATFIEWTRHIPEAERLDFIREVLDRYQVLAAATPQEANTFKFDQMMVVLHPS